MNIQKNKNTKRYLPHELKTREYAVKMYRNCGDIGYVCRKYHISRTSLWRWNKKYDGTIESLKDKLHRPLSKHPAEHTEEIQTDNGIEFRFNKADIKREHPMKNLKLIYFKQKNTTKFYT